jgi:hypothetical protein
MAGYIGRVIALKDPSPGKTRWGQAWECFWLWTTLNIVFGICLLGWILNAPIWARAVCSAACGVTAIVSIYATTPARREQNAAAADSVVAGE